MQQQRIFLSVFISGVDVTGKSKFGRLTHAGAERGLVARLIGNGNNWPLGSICLMGGIGNQSYCLFGSIPCNSSMEASLSDALCLSYILLCDHTCYEWLCRRGTVNNWEILTTAVVVSHILNQDF